MGRQAHMIAVLASMVVQMVELSVPYIWSLALDPVLSVVIRKIDVMQTLTRFQHHKTRIAKETYKPPKAKTIIRPNRCRLGSCNLLTTGIGRASIKKSPIMFAEAFAYQKAVRLMHVPGTAWFQMRSSGVH